MWASQPVIRRHLTLCVTGYYYRAVRWFLRLKKQNYIKLTALLFFLSVTDN